MKNIKSLIILLILTTFSLAGCITQEEAKTDSTSSSDGGAVTMEINLGGNSRAERFLGSFDQINRMALDIDRKLGNKRVATDLELVRVIEDLIRVLADRDILDEGALPIRIRRLLERCRELRNNLT